MVAWFQESHDYYEEYRYKHSGWNYCEAGQLYTIQWSLVVVCVFSYLFACGWEYGWVGWVGMVGSMAPKCTSVVTLTINSCGRDHTNYPRHANNPPLPFCTMISPSLPDCKDISPIYAYDDMFAVSMLLISHSHRINWIIPNSLLHPLLHYALYMHSQYARPALMMHLNICTPTDISVFVW